MKSLPGKSVIYPQSLKWMHFCEWVACCPFPILYVYWPWKITITFVKFSFFFLNVCQLIWDWKLLAVQWNRNAASERSCHHHAPFCSLSQSSCKVSHTKSLIELQETNPYEKKSGLREQGNQKKLESGAQLTSPPRRAGHKFQLPLGKSSN